MRIPEFAEVRRCLRELFADKVAQPAAAAPVVDERKNRNLARLKEWLGDIIADVSGNLDSQDDHTGYGFETNVDVTRYTADDLLAIAPEYEALHDLCLKHNIALEFSGFDILPRRGMTFTDRSWSLFPTVSVHIDRNRTYNGYSHPRYPELKAAGVPLDVSHARQAPSCGLS